jgi:hypothetical protein
MSGMTYQNVDRQLVEALPALLVPHARCLAQDFDGEHPGQYNVFEPVFRACLDLRVPTGRPSTKRSKISLGVGRYKP